MRLSGWAFADAWFAEIGLGISEIEPGSPLNYLVYAVWVFGSFWALFLVICAAMVGLIMAGGLAWAAGRLYQPLVGIVAPLELLVLAVCAIELGQWRAAQLVQEQFISKAGRGFPELELSLKGGTKLECLRQVFQDKNAVYYMKSKARKGTANAKKPSIYRLALSDVTSLKLTKDAPLCHG